MKKMMMAVAFATMMAFSVVLMGCGGEPAPTTPAKKETPKVTPKAATGGAVTSGPATVAPTPKKP